MTVERIAVEFSLWESCFLDPGAESSVDELDELIGIGLHARHCWQWAAVADRRLEVVASLGAVRRIFNGFRVAYADDDTVGHVELNWTAATESFRGSHAECIAIEDIPSSGVSTSFLMLLL